MYSDFEIYKVIVRNITRFHLYKENKDTQEALGVIGKMLGVQVVSMFYFIKVLHKFSVWICRDKG
jgi:hypothetical protein